MINPWKFYDFTDSRGNNLIRAWLDSSEVTEKAAAKIDARILYMQTMRILPEQYVSSLKGWPDIFELKITSAGSQYRPIAFYGPARGEVTLLLGTVEKGKIPRRVLELADGNRKIVCTDRSRIYGHVFRKGSTAT